MKYVGFIFLFNKERIFLSRIGHTCYYFKEIGQKLVMRLFEMCEYRHFTKIGQELVVR